MRFRHIAVVTAALTAGVGVALAQAATQSTPNSAASGSSTAAATSAATDTSTAGATSTATTGSAANAASTAAASSAANAASAPAAAASTKVADNMGPISGDADAGKKKAVACGACHGADGNSSNSMFPKLASQNEHYIVEQLRSFKDGSRSNAIMAGQVTSLSIKDMHDIGAYFAKQDVKPGVADDSLVDHGRALYRGGDTDRGIPACMACHGPDGGGNPGTPYPHLAGQHAEYVQDVLNDWKEGDKWGDSKYDAIMPSIASKLNKKDIKAVSNYIEGLHSNPDNK